MSREYDDELNRADGGRGRSRAERNDRDSSGDASMGRRRASKGSDPYDEDYYFDEAPGEAGYENVDQDRAPGAPEGGRAGSKRMPEPYNNGRMAGEPGAGSPESSRMAGEPGSRNPGSQGTGRPAGGNRAAGEGGSRRAGAAGIGRAAGEGGSRRAGAAGTGRAAGEGGSRNGAVAGTGRVAGEGGSRNAGAAGTGRAAGEGGSRNGAVAGTGRVAGEGGKRNAGAAGTGRAAGEGGSRNGGAAGTGRVAGEGGNRNGAAAGTGRAVGAAGNRRAGAAGATGTTGGARTAGEPAGRSMGVAGSAYRGGETGSRSTGSAGRARNTAQDMPNGAGSPGGPGGQNRSGTPGSRSAAQAAKKKKIRRIIITVVAEILTLICIFSYAYVLRLDSRIKRPGKLDPDVVENQNLTAAQKQHMKGYWTIAVFGVDSRDGNVHKGTNADVVMICNINRDTGEIKLVSVYRDTYLNIDDKSTYNKINSAYSNGGAEQTLAALNRNLDLNIQDYVTFNWKAVADGINMLDGVEDVNITKAEFRYINSFITETVQKTGVPSFHLKSAGVQHLDGVQAVAYGRLRLMDTDYARTERQRIIIQKAFDKAKKADLGLLNRILLMEVEQVETSLSFSDFTDLILDIGKYHIGESSGFPMTLGSQKMGKKGDCVIPQTLESNVIELHKFLYGKEDYEPSSMVTKISAKIAADSGMYKKGSTVDSRIPSGNDDETRETENSTKIETDEFGDENPSASSGETVVETDEFGEPVESTTPDETADGTRPTRPGETTDGETRPTRPGETADGTRPTAPGESSSPAGPGETTAESPGPSGSEEPGGTRPDETRPNSTKPGYTGPSDQTTGPGVTSGTKAESSGAAEPSGAVEPSGAAPTSGAAEPTPAGPVGPDSPGGVTPGGDGNISAEGPPGAA